MTLSQWIQEQYVKLEKLLDLSELELLKDVSEFEGFKNPLDFVVSTVKKELKYYTHNLRFERWMDNKYKRRF